MRPRRILLECSIVAAGLCLLAGAARLRPAAARSAGWIRSQVNGLHIEVLLPAGYDASKRYPVVLYLHQLEMGNYPDALLKQVNQWFDNADFRSRHPCIVVVPMLDQTQDPDGRVVNFGGKRDGHEGEDNTIAAIKQVIDRYSVDTKRVYVTGNSMGGMGTWQMLLAYNNQTGDKGRIFAAGMPLAGRHATANPVAAAKILETVPVWSIHGTNDRVVGLDWDRTMANLMAGRPTFRYTEDSARGHEVWDAYYRQPELWDWLFSQGAAA